MPDIAASDLTYNFQMRDKTPIGQMGYLARGTITFGNGSLTYPTNGIPITKGKMGLPYSVKSLKVIETNAKGYSFEYDVSAEKLRLFLSAGFTPSGTLSSNSAGTPAGTVSQPTFTITGGSPGANLGGAGFGLSSADNANATINEANTNTIALTSVVSQPTFTGSALAGHTHTLSGVAVAAAAFSEASGGSFAPVAVVLEVEAIGH